MNEVQNLAKKFINIMDNNNSFNKLEDGFCIGTITSVNPLIVTVQSLPLYEEDFLIPYYLQEWTEEVNAETTTNDDHSHSIIHITHPSKFQVNRKVFLYGIEPDNNNVHGNYQRYVILGVK